MPISLEEAIQQLINLGEKDPFELVERLKRQHGEEWLREEASLLAEDVAVWLARLRLSNRRNLALVANEHKQHQQELLLASKWVPDKGWIKMGDLTVADCRKIATHYVMLAEAAEIRARFYNEVADMMLEEKVENIAALANKRELPILEDLSDSKALAS